MSVTPRTITAAQLTASAATYYTVPANTKAQLGKITFTNTTATARTITVYLVPSAGSASASNTVISAQPVAPGQCYVAYELMGQVLQAGGTLQALADSATAVTISGGVAEVV